MKRLIILVGLSLSGCYSMQGTNWVLDQDRRVTEVVPADAIFRRDFDDAWKQRQSGNFAGAEVEDMMSSGFGHLYSYCDGYFRSMGRNQRRAKVTRDAIAPISALITGLIALQNFDQKPRQKEDLLAVLGLATAATSSTLDIYDEHMLFGAENIGAVETLAKNAIKAHSTRVMSLENVTFDTAVDHLLDNQALCSPQQLLLLTRDAIKSGKVVAKSSSYTPASSQGTPKNDGNSQAIVGADSKIVVDPNARIVVKIDD